MRFSSVSSVLAAWLATCSPALVPGPRSARRRRLLGGWALCGQRSVARAGRLQHPRLLRAGLLAQAGRRVLRGVAQLAMVRAAAGVRLVGLACGPGPAELAFVGCGVALRRQSLALASGPGPGLSPGLAGATGGRGPAWPGRQQSLGQSLEVRGPGLRDGDFY